MPRPGINYQNVVNAINELLGQEKSITIEHIRGILGTGSASTIAMHLRKWKAQSAETQYIASKENLPEELISIMKGLWERVLSESEERVTTIQQHYQNIQTELETDLEKYKNNNQRWQQLYNQWLQEKAISLNEKNTLEQAVDLLKKENSALILKQETYLQHIQDKQERIDELTRHHLQTQANLEHYREAVREQRIIDQQQYEQQRQELTIELNQFKEHYAHSKEKLAKIQQEYQVLENMHAAVKKENAQLLSEHEKITAKFSILEKEHHASQQSCLHWQEMYKDSQLKNETQAHQLIELQKNMVTISQQLATLKISFQEISDHNKLLAQDKWILAQEKAQLEGQLKQMQTMLESA